MGSEWTTVGNISQVFDGPHATPKKIDEGPYFLSISSLENGKLDLSKSARLSEKDFEKWTKRITPCEGDVLFSYETRLGEAALMPSGIKACLGRRMGLLRPDREKVIPSYLLYAYLSPAFQTEIRRRTNPGATVDRLAIKELPDFPIRIPSLENQKAIAHILGSLDDEIELNRQMNETLEAMAQALFKSWFVDFDPVIDNALAAGNPIPEALQAKAAARQALGNQRKPLPEAIQQQFPSGFEYNDKLGWIPEGWSWISLDSMTDGNSPITYGVVKPGSEDENGVLFIRGGDIENGRIKVENLRTISQEVSQQYTRTLIRGGEVLISLVGNPGQVAIVPAQLKNANIARQVGLIRPHKREDSFFISSFLTSEFGKSQLFSRSMGSVQKVINLKDLKTVKLIKPSLYLQEIFNGNLEVIWQQIQSNREESQTLARLRDTLLPKLLSGELRIPDAEKLVPEAL